MPKIVVIPGNDFEPLKDKPSVKFEGKEILHARLLIHRTVAHELRFSVRVRRVATGTNIPEADAAAYARKVANGEVSLFGAKLAPGSTPRPGRSPYDISVKKQSWVIVELDPRLTNWQFGKGFYGVTTKEAKPGDNFCLRHVYPSSNTTFPSPVGGTLGGEGCKVAYFGVAKRAAGESQFFNLHTDFLQPARPGSTDMHRMIVIFDPDVGNDGGFPIPPP